MGRYEAICRYFRSRQTPLQARSTHHHESLIEEAEQEIKSLSWAELMVAGGVAGVTAWAVSCLCALLPGGHWLILHVRSPFLWM